MSVVPATRPAVARRAASRRGTRRRVSRPLLVALVLLLVPVGAGLGGLWWLEGSLAGNIESLGDPFPEIPRGAATVPDAAAPPPAQQAGPDGAMNLLVLGTDSRISAGDPSQWEVGAQRTDTMMLVHVPADRRNLVVMSIPRDSWVDIPGHGRGRSTPPSPTAGRRSRSRRSARSPVSGSTTSSSPT
ncbi:LCP family protein [Litorihabitans aurantiacus]|uniref:Cell envelope-related transcriptional attenuator domain-containing protein n=1 Tax=Litorihabitans aurantiacus TaxID=1930061 RepID=A0AA38CT66_9MICO|nr:hypothetical protein GCM10025875_27030 [Litorihabitans aurantiacus]